MDIVHTAGETCIHYSRQIHVHWQETGMHRCPQSQDQYPESGLATSLFVHARPRAEPDLQKDHDLVIFPDPGYQLQSPESTVHSRPVDQLEQFQRQYESEGGYSAG